VLYFQQGGRTSANGLINEQTKLIWKAYNYLRWPAKCHFFTVCGLEYWFDLVFLVQVIFAQNFA
jgi:hypothetical protein